QIKRTGDRRPDLLKAWLEEKERKDGELGTSGGD
ncbi:MAG: tRNA (guanosine(37)-N1)-methyltransferase TrmD, partial [Fischerella thermalis M66_A2018_004]|nr:tRNA (guanosine(37)-N1)-methyltransferase TrmD [Fischerella thermalis M66_A2018_004]